MQVAQWYQKQSLKRTLREVNKMSRNPLILILSSTGLLISLVSSSSAYAESNAPTNQSTPNVESATLDDYASFRQTVERYKSRMQTFRDETLSIVEQVKQDQVSAMSKKYKVVY